ncbi:peptidoglycan editing factor PgeF [Martelella alba]|uniref:Purine nucleoside phosphorylase n=1 Tax=Martelella alba TaxID=2590451 RepID=A0A506UCU6_9HYPH|nr:peptidoglycan editing factor PgeF [Martelella alba]TPW31740.1 peptidoglycan editing factor PgeF [Martelella alba]
MLNRTPDLAPLQSSRLAEKTAGTSIRHGFFSRTGGVSTGIYASLNCGPGSKDRMEDVIENRARVAGWFGATADNLITVHQVHSAEAVAVSAPFADGRPQADALVTKTPGLVLGVLTADCGPVLFADPSAGVIAAAHSGWRGAFTGILEATITAMEKMGAMRENITACLGPTISRAAYEVGPEFVATFKEHNTDNHRFFSPSINRGHAMFDLPAFVGEKLNAAGIGFEIIDHCTYGDEDGLFSYRRTTHRREADYGRQISAIAIGER